MKTQKLIESEKSSQEIVGNLTENRDEAKVISFLKDAGYSDSEIKQGLEYARMEGYRTKDELGQLALSRILYSDIQLERGNLVPWEPLDWELY